MDNSGQPIENGYDPRAGEGMNVLITTLAGIASLSDPLPELPVPGPLQAASSSSLLHPGIAEDAKRALMHNDPQLVQRVSDALSRTNVDYVDIGNRMQSTVVPDMPLMQAVYAQTSHANYNNMNQLNHVGMNNQMHHNNMMPNNAQQQQMVMINGINASAGSPYPTRGSVQVNLGTANLKTAKIDVNRLTKEEQAMMQKGLRELQAGGGGSGGQYNNFSPRHNNTRSSSSSNNNNHQAAAGAAGRSKYIELSNSESDTEDEAESKPKSKFFKHTEKERDDERRRQREERRANRRQRRENEEDGEYQPTPEEMAGAGAGMATRKRKNDESAEQESIDWLKRRRRDDSVLSDIKPTDQLDLDNYVPKKVTRKIEMKTVPKPTKVDTESLMESSNFQRFHRAMETIFDNAEEVNLKELEENDDGEIPPEILIPKYQATDLASETAKLKSQNIVNSVPTNRLVKLLSLLQWNIRDGSKVIPIANDDDDDDDDKLFLEVAMERVSRAADCSICALNIMTSKNMDKQVFIDDVIDKIAMFIRFQLQNTIYPSYDPVYKDISKSKEGYMGSMKKKRNFAHTVRDRNILNLYNKCNEVVALLAELLPIQLLTDTTVLHLSTLGVAPFFVENIPELQLSALKLVTGVFTKYEKHRRLVLDDILASIARLPSTKRSLRSYSLNQHEKIQMLTALILQLIQCVVILPDLGKANNAKKKGKQAEVIDLESGEPELPVDRDLFVNNRYSGAMATAYQFLSVFLMKCGSKHEEIDYRPLFENFLQDLLTTVNTPEWPAAELLLSILGKLLLSNFSNKGTDLALRISSLEYLGTVASRLRKDVVQSKLKLDTIDKIISCVKECEEEEGDEVDEAFEKLDEEEKRTRFLQRVLLDYLTVKGGEEDTNVNFSRHFYISQWYRDANAEISRQKGMEKPKKKAKKAAPAPSSRTTRNRRGVTADTESEESEDEEEDDEDEPNEEKEANLAEIFRLTEERKNFLCSKISPFGDVAGGKGRRQYSISSHLDDTSATLIVKYLSSKRPFFNSFDFYLRNILFVLREPSVQVRSKALKCLASIVQEDPTVLSKDDVQYGVKFSLMDGATMVREAAVDLVGKFILHKQDLIDQYYDMLLARILDTGVSVRKRVIKILKDICMEFPDYRRIPEICVKMIRRIDDEEGIRKLVMEVFQNMWFAPMNDRRPSDMEKHLLVTKAHNITDVVVACKDTGLEWFEQLLQTLFKPKEDKDDATKINKEPPKHLVLACQQIVDCLVETVLKSEERLQDGEPAGQSHRIVACLTTTFLFAKIRPQLLINHVQTLQPYLNIKCVTQGDYQIISHVARTLELTVPLIEHPSQIFLSQLEEASVKLVMMHDKTVVSACLSCLGSVVNNVTKNFVLVRDCFFNYFQQLLKAKQLHKQNPNDPKFTAALPHFRRALFTVGLLLRHFDFKKEELYAGLEWGERTKDMVFETVYYFIEHESLEIQKAVLQSVGNICIRHYDLMMEDRLKNKYIDILTSAQRHTHHRIQEASLLLQVLSNIETYLVEEEIRMINLDKHWKEYADKENLKEMGDVSSGMASTIIQIYLQAILESFIHPSESVRRTSLKVTQLVLSQGLVHPVSIIPYLICMSTDSDTRISHTADKELQDMEKKHPGFIHSKLMQGIRLSFNLQKILTDGTEETVLRGFRSKDGELPSALNGFLYSCMRSTKNQRRAILLNLLKQFDDTAQTDLSMKLYLADNLAYIPYTVVDEPLFIIHHIDINVSVYGSNILQSIKETLKLPPDHEFKINQETGQQEVVYDEDLDDDKESVLSRLPDDLTALQHSLISSQGCLLLLVLREHIKDLYGINETKIQGYSPSESQKIYERPVNRKAAARFNPVATVELLKLGDPVPAQDLTEDGKRELVDQYLGFKDLMNKIDKDDEEYDDDGNPIPQGPQLNARELQNMGMSTVYARANGSSSSNGGPGPPPPPIQNLPPGIPGRPESFNPVIQIQKIPLNSLPAGSLPVPATTSSEPVVASGPGYLDPETGDWIPEAEGSESPEQSTKTDKKTAVTPLKISLKDRNAQDSNKVPKLTINLGGKQNNQQKHGFLEDLDRSAREHDQRRKKSKPHKEKHKKKKKKKKYQSESEDSSDCDSDVEYP